MLAASNVLRPPYTKAVRKALEEANNPGKEADLLFLEAWEMRPEPLLGATLRASQIRRANPGLAAAIDAELKGR
jgi:hypothetical protein